MGDSPNEGPPRTLETCRDETDSALLREHVPYRYLLQGLPMLATKGLVLRA